MNVFIAAKIGGAAGIQQGVMKELLNLINIRKPDPQIVLLLEAVLIIITPTRYFKGPAVVVGSVSWEASRRIMSDIFTLYTKMKAVNLEQVYSHVVFSV